jgi:hypothetical protein
MLEQKHTVSNSTGLDDGSFLDSSLLLILRRSLSPFDSVRVLSSQYQNVLRAEAVSDTVYSPTIRHGIRELFFGAFNDLV